MIIASIDIGTNTVLMVIAKYNDNGTLETIKNEFTIPRIGKGLTPGSPISNEKKELLLEILENFTVTARSYKADKIIATATNAFRIASNSKEITDLIRKMGIDISIVSGEKESYYAYLGAISGLNDSEDTLVIDIGGGSTEIIYGKDKDIFYRKSFQTGVVSLTEKYFREDPPSPASLDAAINGILEIFSELKEKKFNPSKAVAIAGTPTTLACTQCGLKEFDEEAIEGSCLKREDIMNMVSEISGLASADILRKYNTVVKGREDVLLAGTLILYNLLDLLGLKEVNVSTKGIRYGAIINNLRKN